MAQEKTFTRKNYGTLYKWSVRTGLQGRKGIKQTSIGCTAIIGSQGQDWLTGYVYNKVVVDGQLQRLAYVQCGYAQ